MSARGTQLRLPPESLLFIGECVEPVPEAFRGGEVCTLYLEGQAAPGREDVQGGQGRTVRSAELHEKGRVNRRGFC